MSVGASARNLTLDYDILHAILEEHGEGPAYFNVGYAKSLCQDFAARQEQLVREVLDAAELRPEHRLADVGFGSGEQDFFAAAHYPFARLDGFNTSARQVQKAQARVDKLGLGKRLRFHHQPAEAMSALTDHSVDRVIAVESAPHFDRPRFYAEAARVLVPGGRMVLADIALAPWLSHAAQRGDDDLRRMGDQRSNRSLWEKHFRTRSVRNINRNTLPGCQQSVFVALRILPRVTNPVHRRHALNLAVFAQIMATALLVSAFRYDLVVLERP
jgi:ubiquinone/menaquinone biosynthesis C-methylase UbiE